MDFRQLRAFVAVAEAGGFSRATGAAHASQPTLSRLVARLEDGLGRRVFDRLGRRVVLTDYGREVLRRAREILADVNALSGAGSAGVAGPLRIGIADSVVLGRFPDLLRRFLRRHPRVTAEVHTGLSPGILEWVREGRVDVGLSMLPTAAPGVQMRRLWRDRFLTVVPSRHPLAGRRGSLPRLARERLLGLQPGTLSHEAVAAAFQRAGTPYRPAMTFDSFHALVAFVGAGLGAGVATEASARPAIRRGRVARVAIGEIESLPRDLGAIWHADRDLTGPLEALLDLLDEAV